LQQDELRRQPRRRLRSANSAGAKPTSARQTRWRADMTQNARRSMGPLTVCAAVAELSSTPGEDIAALASPRRSGI
jgi:hypothetical protein